MASWIIGTETNTPVLTIEPQLDKETLDNNYDSQPYNLISLGKIHLAIRESVTEYLSQKTTPIIPPKLESRLQIESALELPKIIAIQQAISFVEDDIPLAKQVKNNLSEIATLMKEYLCPLESHKINVEHLSKAKRVLKSKRAIQIFRSLTGDSGEKLAFKLELESIELATELNHALLLQDLEKYLQSNYDNASVASIREGIENHVIPELSKDLYKDPAKMTEAIKSKLFPYIVPIVSYIVKKYPHTEEAYLLNSNIQSKKANCSGKAMMLGLLLQDIGLDARVAIANVTRYETIYGHAYDHVYLPHGSLLEIDGNQSDQIDIANFFFGCNVAILVEDKVRKKLTLDQYPSWNDLVATHDKAYVLADHELTTYMRTWGSETHKVSHDEKPKYMSIDTISMLVDFKSQPTNRLHKLNYALSLLNIDVEKNTHNPNLGTKVARTIFEYTRDTVGLDRRKKEYYLEWAIKIAKKSVTEMPHEIRAHEQLLQIIDYQIRNTPTPEQTKRQMIEYESISLKLIQLKRVLPKSIDTERSIYSVASSLVHIKQLPSYQEMVLEDSPSAIRNDLRESILILENSTTKYLSEMKTKKLVIQELRKKLASLKIQSF